MRSFVFAVVAHLGVIGFSGDAKADFTLDVPAKEMLVALKKTTLGDLAVGDTAKVYLPSNFCRSKDGMLAISKLKTVNESEGGYLDVANVKVLPGDKVAVELQPGRDLSDSAMTMKLRSKAQAIGDFLRHAMSPTKCAAVEELDGTKRDLLIVDSVEGKRTMRELLNYWKELSAN